MRRLAVLVVFALVLTGCGSSGSSDDEAAAAAGNPGEAEPAPTAAPAPEPEPTSTPTPPTLELVGDGPYPVGVATVTVAGDTDRPLTVDIWFPLVEGVEADPVRYSFVTGDFYESPRALAADATQLSPDGPFPLVVYSHGSGGVRYIHSDYTEVLASHGYVVAAPDHTGNTSVELFLGTEVDPDVNAVNRPDDVITVIDAMTDPADPVTGPYAAAVDGERIAVTGHSFGGFTSYAVVSGFMNDVGSIPADDRVDAIIPLAPAVGPRDDTALLSDERLAAVDVPALVIVGSDDTITPVDPNVERAWELTSSSPHYRLELIAAEHQSFTDVCDYVAAFDAGQEASAPVREIIESFAVAGCSEGDMPIDRVQELTNTFAIRFLESVFGDGEMIDPAATEAIDDVVYAVK